ncbi:MAG: tetratricopeptide repeat protein [Myxococcota bacterium]|nr:tetratricopeptide repeat protein [Myxococcota bacterium]
MTRDKPPSSEPSSPKADELIAADEEGLADLVPKLKRALALRAEGEDDKARALFEEVLRVEPRIAEARLELAHFAAMQGDWEEGQAHARLAIEILRRDGQWTEDVEPNVLLSFALNLLGELLVRPLEEGDLFLTDRPRFDATWNEASALFDAAVELDSNNVDARRNGTRYRRLEPEN